MKKILFLAILMLISQGWAWPALAQQVKDKPTDPVEDRMNLEDPEPVPQPPAPEPQSSGGGGGGRSRRARTAAVVAQPVGQVLGASISCSPYLTSYLGQGRVNNPEEVKKLQSFLNEQLGSNLPLTGFFGPLTRAAVNQFQLRHAGEILRPWLAFGLPSEQMPTGYVYKTTTWKINNLVCPSLGLSLPLLP